MLLPLIFEVSDPELVSSTVTEPSLSITNPAAASAVA